MTINENQYIQIDGCVVAPGDWFACVDESLDTSAVYYVGQDGRQYASYLSEINFFPFTQNIFVSKT
jgi:hypothetical protein